MHKTLLLYITPISVNYYYTHYHIYNRLFNPYAKIRVKTIKGELIYGNKVRRF